MKKEFPAQTKNREKWIIETVKVNQRNTGYLLLFVAHDDFSVARDLLNTMHKQDRDALLLLNGILTGEQIEKLGFDQKTESQEPEPISTGST